VNVVVLLLGNGRLTARCAAIAGIVVTEIDARGIRQSVEPLDGSVQRARAGAREVAARGAAVRREQRVADESRIADEMVTPSLV
jgi:hypothetical protein